MSMHGWLRLEVLLVCCSISACQAARFVGSACEEDGCALHSDSVACIVSELRQDVSIRDRPGEHPEVALCTNRQLSRNGADLVNCRMFWSYGSGDPAGSSVRHSCADHDFLSQAEDSEVFDDDSDPDQHCLVRQVTEVQAKSGMTGWYYSASIPTQCPELGPGVVIPSQRPDESDWEIYASLQCATSIALGDDGSVADVEPSECAAPSGGDATGVWQECMQRVQLTSDDPIVDLGAPDCQTGACVTVPQHDVTCSSEGGMQLCAARDTHCSCRCAGEPGDPGPFCACPDDYECRPLLTAFAASPAIRGSYCVPAGSVD